MPLIIHLKASPLVAHIFSFLLLILYFFFNTRAAEKDPFFVILVNYCYHQRWSHIQRTFIKKSKPEEKVKAAWGNLYASSDGLHDFNYRAPLM